MENNNLQAEKQLIRTWKSVMALSCLTIIVGIACIIQGVNEIVKNKLNIGVIWIIYGLAHIFVACFGIRFSKKKDDIQNAKYIVRRKKGVCILGGVAYGATVSFFLLTLIFAEFSYIEFIIMSCCTSCMLFISFLLFCMYREQKIIVKEKEIIICNFLGKKKVIDRQEVDKIVTDQNQIRYSFLNKQNKIIIKSLMF